MIDLRKDRRRLYLVEKDTLELETREDYERRTHNEIYAFMAHIITGCDYSCTINPKWAQLTKDEYKLFRKFDEDSKRLYIECK